jgi:multidrug resistance efflux pump
MPVMPNDQNQTMSRWPKRWEQQALPWVLTGAAVAVAGVLGMTMWRRYVEAPWTRDGTVRADVVTMAPEVAGRIVELRVADNQYVHKGELLMVIDPTDYQIAVSRGTAVFQQAKLDAQNLQLESARRDRLARLDAVAQEQATNYQSNASIAEALVEQTTASLQQARVNLERTHIRSPVNGWVTNLLARRDDYATVGRDEISIVDAESFWVDGYFEETKLGKVCEGDRARVQLIGYSQVIDGHVDSVARGIHVPNSEPNLQGLATVNPIYTWVRLAQRIPVRIDIDKVPQNVRLVAGLTATVRLVPKHEECHFK